MADSFQNKRTNEFEIFNFYELLFSLQCFFDQRSQIILSSSDWIDLKFYTYDADCITPTVNKNSDTKNCNT